MQHAEKIYKGKVLAILSGGGDTPAINSSIEQIRNRALILGFKVYGIRSGWKGLLGDGDIVNLTNIIRKYSPKRSILFLIFLCQKPEILQLAEY